MQRNALKKPIVGHILWSLLGEEELCISVSADLPDSYSTTVKTGYGAGYRLDIGSGNVMVRRVDRLAVMAGFPPVYYFQGTLLVENESKVLKGRIRMALLPRWFILTWSFFMSLALIVSVFTSVLLLWGYWISPEDAAEARMVAAGFFVGMVVIVGSFGAMIIGVIRWMSAKQRYQLKQFCYETMGLRINYSN